MPEPTYPRVAAAAKALLDQYGCGSDGLQRAAENIVAQIDAVDGRDEEIEHLRTENRRLEVDVATQVAKRNAANEVVDRLKEHRAELIRNAAKGWDTVGEQRKELATLREVLDDLAAWDDEETIRGNPDGWRIAIDLARAALAPTPTEQVK